MSTTPAHILAGGWVNCKILVGWLSTILYCIVYLSGELEIYYILIVIWRYSVTHRYAQIFFSTVEKNVCVCVCVCVCWGWVGVCGGGRER